jgi:RND family efflux transporter MFP subunit
MHRKALAWGAAVTLAAGVAVAAVVAGPGLPGLGGKKADKPEVTLEFRAGEVVRPRRTVMPLELSFSGPLVAPQTAVVRSKATGTLLTLAVAEGSRVRAGQVLGTLDLAELDSRLGERAAMLESARARLAQAEHDHAANEALAAQGFISANALQASRTALDAAQAQWRAAQAQVDTVRVTRRDAALLAPIDGVVAKRHALPGEKLSAEQPVATLVDLATLELAGAVGTHEVARLAPGMPVQVSVEGLDAPRAATLARIAPAAEPGTRSIGVAAVLPNPDERLRAGQYATARVVLDDPVQRLTLPVSAISGAPGQEGVWVIDGGVLVRRAVVLGRRDPAAGRVEVLQGVADGDVVLGARFDHLRDGAKAVVVEEPGVSAASTPGSRATAN